MKWLLKIAGAMVGFVVAFAAGLIGVGIVQAALYGPPPADAISLPPPIVGIVALAGAVVGWWRAPRPAALAARLRRIFQSRLVRLVGQVAFVWSLVLWVGVNHWANHFNFYYVGAKCMFALSSILPPLLAIAALWKTYKARGEPIAIRLGLALLVPWSMVVWLLTYSFRWFQDYSMPQDDIALRLLAFLFVPPLAIAVGTLLFRRFSRPTEGEVLSGESAPLRP